MRIKNLILVAFLHIVSGCNNNTDITTSYLEFSKKPKYLNGFSVSLINVHDSKTPPQQYSEVKGERYAFVTDRSFQLSKRLYFDRKQKGFQWVKLDGAEKIDAIGELRKSSWYVFNNLHDLGYRILVYIDEGGKSEIYIDQRVNW
jgi:hypothetical protein